MMRISCRIIAYSKRASLHFHLEQNSGRLDHDRAALARFAHFLSTRPKNSRLDFILDLSSRPDPDTLLKGGLTTFEYALGRSEVHSISAHSQLQIPRNLESNDRPL